MQHRDLAQCCVTTLGGGWGIGGRLKRETIYIYIIDSRLVAETNTTF